MGDGFVIQIKYLMYHSFMTFSADHNYTSIFLTSACLHHGNPAIIETITRYKEQKLVIV